MRTTLILLWSLVQSVPMDNEHNTLFRVSERLIYVYIHNIYGCSESAYAHLGLFSATSHTGVNIKYMGCPRPACVHLGLFSAASHTVVVSHAYAWGVVALRVFDRKNQI